MHTYELATRVEFQESKFLFALSFGMQHDGFNPYIAGEMLFYQEYIFEVEVEIEFNSLF